MSMQPRILQWVGIRKLVFFSTGGIFFASSKKYEFVRECLYYSNILDDPYVDANVPGLTVQFLKYFPFNVIL